MATTKLTTDVEQYLKWAGADGTTQQQYQEFVRNMYGTLSDVVKITMWQPNTSYSAGAVLVSPDMPENTLARVVVAGTTGDVIPTWGAAGDTIADGTVKWKMLYRTMDNATQEKSGYMSASDKVKLDGIDVKSVTESAGKVTVTKSNGNRTTFDAGLNILTRNKIYAVGDIAYSPNLPSYLYLECTTAGITGATEPNMSTVSGGAIINDGTATFIVRDKRMQAMIDMFYPIGSVYMSADKSKTKADFPFMAYGTWEEVPANLCLQTGAASEAGTQRSAGLPNITGHAGSTGTTCHTTNPTSGAIVPNPDIPVGSIPATNVYGRAGNTMVLGFDASKSNPIYGSSDTVQPPAYMVRAWVRTA